MVIPAYAQDSTGTDLSKKILELRLKSNAQSKFVNELLSEDVVIEPLANDNDIIELEGEPVEEINDSLFSACKYNARCKFDLPDDLKTFPLSSSDFAKQVISIQEMLGFSKEDVDGKLGVYTYTQYMKHLNPVSSFLSLSLRNTHTHTHTHTHTRTYTT